MHYGRWKNNGDPLVSRGRWDDHERRLNNCEVPGCEWVGYKRRVCPKHAMRMRRYGSYDTVLPKGPQRGDDHARFWSKVHKTDTCWLWTGTKQKKWGYGVFRVGGRSADGKTWLAHRYAYTISVGPIPEGMLVCHHCDVPACVNPSHFFIGTDADNNHDMESKGRGRHPSGADHGTHRKPESIRRGTANANAIISDEDVREIRALYAGGGISQEALAGQFGVHQGTVSRIIRRTAWAHVDKVE